MGETELEAASTASIAAVPPRRRPETDVLALAGIMLVFALVAFLAIPATDPVRDSGLWVLAAIGILYAASELTVFHFEFRREAISFSLSEVPTAFALIFLAPAPTFLVRVLASVVVLLAVRRPPLYKVVFNVAIYALEVSLAFLVFDSLLPVLGSEDPAVVLAVIMAVAIPGFLSSVLVSIAISRFEGGMFERILADVRVAGWLFIVNGTIAGMTVGLALVAPGLAVFALIPVAFLWYVMKAYGLIDQRLRDLEAVHGFTAHVGRSLDPDKVGDAAVAEIARLMRSVQVGFVVFDIHKVYETDAFTTLGIRLPRFADDPEWQTWIDAEGAQLVDGKDVPGGGPVLEERQAGVIIVPVDDGTEVIGLVMMTGREGASRRFDPRDLARAQNLTEQLAASVRKAALHQQIEREAREDSLTNLPNRRSFERSIAAAKDDPPEHGNTFVAVLDLDRFKEVNDTLGHESGDVLLVEVAGRLQERLHAGDVLARLAGDEFAMLCARRNEQEMVEFVEACVAAIGEPVSLDGLEIVVTASAGVAVIRDKDADPTVALRHADIAMYNAKQQRLGVDTYRDEIDRRTPDRLSMLGDLRAAIEGGGLDVNYQPKLDLASGLVVGAEALVRWTHSVRGEVPPSQFVRVAEDTGMIKQLTDLMLQRGTSKLREIHDRGHRLSLSVNLSTHDLLDTRLASRVDSLLVQHEVDPTMLTLEITESSLLIDAPRSRQTIHELNEIGVRMSIDDFGTGYSSLSYLRRLPVSELKIDRSFVANVLLDDQDEVIVRSTIDLGHNLGLEVVAEGVENNEILDRLRAFGCDVAQGFCISRPLKSDHLLPWLSTTSHPSRSVDPFDPAPWAQRGRPSPTEVLFGPTVGD